MLAIGFCMYSLTCHKDLMRLVCQLYFIDEDIDIGAQGATVYIIQGHIVGGFARTQTQPV